MPSNFARTFSRRFVVVVVFLVYNFCYFCYSCITRCACNSSNCLLHLFLLLLLLYSLLPHLEQHIHIPICIHCWICQPVAWQAMAASNPTTFNCSALLAHSLAGNGVVPSTNYPATVCRIADYCIWRVVCAVVVVFCCNCCCFDYIRFAQTCCYFILLTSFFGSL